VIAAINERFMMAIRIVRMKSGEEIITDYTEKDNIAILKNPAILIPTGQGQIGFMPWMMYAELENNTVEFDTENVLFHVAPAKALMNEYNKTIGSGLIVPETPTMADTLKISGS